MPAPHVPPSASTRTDDPHRAVRYWLYGIALLVTAMVVVGGATRLTESGLSITEWQPLLGAIPPLSHADWLAAFQKYQQIPQYHINNKGMTLDQFQFIYWWEWAHRLLGRAIGVVFAVPFVWFLVRRRIPAGMGWKLAGIFALGGLQGAIGWYMVKSGLVDRTEVSEYRLALHLAVAMLILTLTLWAAFSLLPRDTTPHLATLRPGHRWTARLLVPLVLLQITLGALVAGLRAGLSHNTWPLMDGQIIPSGLGAMSPWWLNLFENALTVQFDHRMVAYLLIAVVAWHAVRVGRVADDRRIRRSAWLFAASVVAQACLGIWTLLAMVPLWLGLAHQAMAVVVLSLATWHLFTITREA